MYFRINSSDLKDPRWAERSFGKQRCRDVHAAIQFLEKHETQKYNLHSLATAKLGCVVVSAVGGKKAQVSPGDFLPFDPSKQKDQSGVTPESLAILKYLMKSRALDPRLISTLASEIKMASLREDD